MVHSDDSPRKRRTTSDGTPLRPARRIKPKSKDVALEGSSGSDERESVADTQTPAPKVYDISVLNSSYEEDHPNVKVLDPSYETEIDKIEFSSGDNKIQLVLKKRNSRQYKMAIFLNGKTEIRPSTYNGSTMAYTFWNLLKNSVGENPIDQRGE